MRTRAALLAAALAAILALTACTGPGPVGGASPAQRDAPDRGGGDHGGGGMWHRDRAPISTFVLALGCC